MANRVIIGSNPGDGLTGLWVTYPGFSANVPRAARRNRLRFAISTDWPERVPLRVLMAGFTRTNTAIPLGRSFASIPGEVVFTFQPMVDAENEQPQAYYGTDNDGSGNAYDGSEYRAKMFNPTTNNPSWRVYNVNNLTSTGYPIRYFVVAA